MTDHLSSPRPPTAPACDICGLYVFPSPERPGNLVLVMTALPRASAAPFFSEEIAFRFRLRPASIAGVGPRTRFAVGADASELVVDCTFATPSSRAGSAARIQEGGCSIHARQRASVVVHDRGGAAGEGMRMFAGLVSDPFIFQFESLLKTITTGRVAFQKGAKNSLEGANVLALVIEVERDKWLAGGPLFAVVAETLAMGSDPIRLDRVGRPEVKSIGIQCSRYDPINRGIDVCEPYGREDVFHLDGQHLDAYRARLNANFRFFDGLDGKIDWPPNQEGNHPLLDLVLDDYLIVDVSKPFTKMSFFEIEQAALEGRAHRTCGGRALNDDSLDTYYTLLINAGKGPRITDGVDQATVPASNVFPYLAPPNVPPNLPGANGRSEAGARAEPPSKTNRGQPLDYTARR